MFCPYFLLLQDINFYRVTQSPLQIHTCGKCQLNIYIHMLIVSNANQLYTPNHGTEHIQR